MSGSWGAGDTEINAHYESMKMKLKQSNICFECKKQTAEEDLNQCADLEHDSFWRCSKVLSICNTCLKKEESLRVCREYNFFYVRIVPGRGCGNVVCSTCVEGDDAAVECEECSNWFCKSCEDKCCEKTLCTNCGSTQMACPVSEGRCKVKNCVETRGKIGGDYRGDRGGCGTPLCDECVFPTYCGITERLSRDCQRDHACEYRTCYSYSYL